MIRLLVILTITFKPYYIMKSLNIQVKALIIATIVLTTLFVVMINVHGFRNF